MLDVFEERHKDVVFLVEANDSMRRYMRKAVVLMKHIFGKYLQDEDRVALIKYSKNCHLRFPLTRKSHNTEQLRNQIVAL